MEIRDRRSADLDDLVPLVERVHLLDNYPIFLRDGDVARFLRNPVPIAAWVAIREGRLIGHVALNGTTSRPTMELAGDHAGNGRVAYVARLVVDPDSRGQGIGRVRFDPVGDNFEELVFCGPTTATEMRRETTGAWSFRSAKSHDAAFLRSMLYEALYVHDGEDPFPQSILDEPNIRHYVADFGEWTGDLGVIGVDDGNPAGACWLRAFGRDDPGYGWVADDVPELSVAVIDDVRGQGLGTLLIEAVLKKAAEQGVERISLSVDPRSPAFRLYERLGFEQVGREGTSVTMLRSL